MYQQPAAQHCPWSQKGLHGEFLGAPSERVVELGSTISHQVWEPDRPTYHPSASRLRNQFKLLVCKHSRYFERDPLATLPRWKHLRLNAQLYNGGQQGVMINKSRSGLVLHRNRRWSWQIPNALENYTLISRLLVSQCPPDLTTGHRH